jgi:cytochrome c553
MGRDMNRFALLLCLTFIHSSAIAVSQGDAEAGKAKSAVCAACHGPDGNSPLAMNPKIAGQGEKYLLKQLHDFKKAMQTAGKEGRNNAVMGGMVMPLSDQDMADLAAYYAAQTEQIGTTPEDAVEAGAKLYMGGDVERKITACVACHGPKGNGMGLAGFPDISGQHASYTETQLKAFRSGARANDANKMMRDIAAKLTDQDIALLASYLEGLH